MTDKSISSILNEQRVFPPAKEFVDQANLKAADVEALYQEAEADHEAYWARLAREEIHWQKPFTEVLDSSDAPNFRWFSDGELNVSYNCLDVHLEKRADKTAIIFEGEGGDQRQDVNDERGADRISGDGQDDGLSGGNPARFASPFLGLAHDA